MVVTSRIQIKAPLEEIWEFLIDPEKIPSWNSRMRVVVPVSQGHLRDGSKFRLRYSFLGRESNYLAEVLEYEEQKRLVIHMTGGCLHVRGYIQEIYELAGGTGGTMMTQKTVLENTGINPLSRAFMKGRYLFGGLAGKRDLSGLKKLADREA